ncbi:hypothetical protein ACLOJK_008730 [Asimina triloba]
MSGSQPDGRGDGDGEGEKGKEAAIAKTAGFVVFSGIAMSILKALNLNFCQHTGNNAPKPCEKSTPSIDNTKNQSSLRTIEIVKGDTLWGLSRKYGVSIDAIKEANGLSGDTIYAGKKLIIP